MADHSESRRSEAARPCSTTTREAEPDTLQPPLTAEPQVPGAIAIAPPAAPPAVQPDQPDLAAYDWYPVLRKPRADGWSVDVQRHFIEVLADTGSVLQACQAVGKSKSSAYALRRSPGSEGFAGAWRIAIDNAAACALDECFERALVGSDEPVFNPSGARVGRRFRQSDRLLMFLLRAYMPDRFRYAGREVRTPDEPPPAHVPPLAAAIALVAPPCPVDPQAMLDPDTLEERLWIADICNGEKPHWHSGVTDTREDAAPTGLGQAFEDRLEAAKRAADGLPPRHDDDED